MDEQRRQEAWMPDFVNDAEEAMANEQASAVENQEVTIKFGKGLVSEPFLSKNGKELVEIKIPNADRGDSRPWESFVISPKMVHDNKFGKGVWMKLPVDGQMRLARAENTGKLEDGRSVWKNNYRVVSNTELKGLLEAYKTRNSIHGKLEEKKTQSEAAQKRTADPPQHHETAL